MACVTVESLARLFIDEGLVFVSANCVFSNFNSCVALPTLTTTRGSDLDVGIALALGAGSAGVEAADGVDAAPEYPFLEAASMAFNSASVTPEAFIRMSSLVEVLNLPGLA